MTMTAATPRIAEGDQLRADLYGLLAALLARAPDKALLRKLAGLSGDDSELGRAVATLARLSAEMGPARIEREFTALFIGLGRGELLPYASYYMTGFLNEKPLALLRQDMMRAGISRAPNVFEPEDNIASLCEMMQGLITGRFGAPAPLARQRDFFNRHIAPWAEHFFTDLEGAKGSLFYVPVGALGRHFVRIETEAFRLTGG